MTTSIQTESAVNNTAQVEGTNNKSNVPVNTIEFQDLEKYNDTNSFVWLGLLLPNNKKEIKALCEEITEWLLAEGFIKTGKIKNLLNIVGNVKNDRNDVLVIFNKGCGGLHPLKRLCRDDMKWTSDFIYNYASDYGIVDEYEYDEDEEVA